MSILRFDNVSYQYPGEDFDIIDDLSFSVEPGSFHCIVGVSGCGKSTIFRMINGLLPPMAGTSGATERIVGAWLKRQPRDRVVLATKLTSAGRALDWIRGGPRANDRENIREAVEGSLRRLGTD